MSEQDKPILPAWKLEELATTDPDAKQMLKDWFICCDICDHYFDPDGDEDCQVGGDRSQGEGWPDRAVPSLCPECLEKAMRGL